MIGLPEGKDIVEVDIGIPGPTADIKLFHKSQSKFDKSQAFSGDKAYQGSRNITKWMTIKNYTAAQRLRAKLPSQSLLFNGDIC